MYGAESVILNLCKWFNAQRHRCSLAVFVNHPRPVPELYRNCLGLDIECHLIPAAGKMDSKAVHKIREIADSSQADVVHAHGYKADIFVYLALRGTQVCYVATCHNWLDNDWRSRLYGRLDRWILPKYYRVAAVSEEVARRLQCAGVRSHRIELIGNGIDLQSFQLAEQRSELQTNAVVGFVGRLSSEKGPDVFLRAAQEVSRSDPNVQFLIAGDGPQKSALESLSRDLGIEGKIRFLKHVTNMPALYQKLDLLVSASRREGLPIAILEAMASGVPVIATTVGDIPRIIDHGHTGLLAPPDAPQALGRAVLQLLEDPIKRGQLRVAARKEIVEHYSVDRMCTNYLEFYKNAIAADVQRAR
jgi:glycosyltransferase involved in cell wall biosynthesis